MHAVFWFGSLVLQRKDCVLFPTATRRRMSGDSRSYSCLRSTTPVSLDALGRGAQCWTLPRYIECCSWSHAVSDRIFASCAHKATTCLTTTPSATTVNGFAKA